MYTTGATEARKNWSSLCDNVSRVRPEIIKRTHDLMFLSSRENMLSLLNNVKYHVSVFDEEDGSITAALDDIDLVENAENQELALNALAKSILEYADEYYDNYQLYSKAPNRRPHLPHVTKALLLDDENSVREEMLCRSGRN